jgi:heme/copper-type cytochrome/quinol oxidase subunit 2
MPDINATQSHSLQPSRKPKMLRSALLTLALVLATGTSAGAQEPAYTLVIKDHQFQPTEIEIPAGKKIALLVKNNDTTPEEFESTELRREKVVAGGEQITVYIGPLRPGKYEFFGDFNPKTARGHIIAK